ncbi:MFS transporter [Galbitalea sp. SE-J8]|uniref:MFS transporter n=1 Tax=Galbitalea sp. SE-J8 TaxID=3054952 RepID=UPI00259C8117|nr:MFS transporter [Galbitalea sp. SE-J8]MDM4761748.1 MFS transporter [Galbitalea sp. SE-J8]
MTAGSAAGPQPASAKPFGWRFVAPLMVGSSLNPINTSMIATALVGIGTDFEASPGTTAALISVLYLCSAVAQPTMGKLAALVGPRRTFLGGIVVLLVAGVIGAAAPAFWVLLISRGLIGIGTSAAYPTAMTLIRRRADDLGTGTPARTLGSLSIAAQVTATFGLPLGGVLVGAFGWRSIFAVNIPVALVCLVLTLTGVPRDAPAERRDSRGFLVALDLPGIALFAGTIVALLLFLAGLAAPDWWLLAIAVVLLALLVLRELRAANPLLDVRMLRRNAALDRTYLRLFVIALINYSALLGVSQWLEQARGLTAGQVGLVMLPLTAVSAVIARVVSNRGWVRWPLIAAGLGQIAAGLISLAITSESSILLVIGMTIVLGAVNGASGFGNQASLYLQAPPDQIGVASGLLRTFMYVGAIFSSSLLAIAYGDRATDAGFHALSLALVGAGAVLALLAALDRRIPSTAR